MLMCSFRITSSNKLVLSLNLYLASTNQEVAGVSSYVQYVRMCVSVCVCVYTCMCVCVDVVLLQRHLDNVPFVVFKFIRE